MSKQDRDLKILMFNYNSYMDTEAQKRKGDMQNCAVVCGRLLTFQHYFSHLLMFNKSRKQRFLFLSF